MTTFWLIRHALTDHVGEVLSGRTPDVHLSAAGRAQAEVLAARLTVPFAAVYSSPLERAVETAQPIALANRLTLIEDVAFTEIDFGAWTGARFFTLDDQPTWKRWNTLRGLAAPPNGEPMTAVQTRVMSRLWMLAETHGDAPVAVVTHAEVIRALLALVLGSPLDLFSRIEISPASITIIQLDVNDVRVLRVNDTGM